MSTENLATFFSKVGTDPDLTAKVTALEGISADEKVAALVQLSEETGTPFTAEELRDFFASLLSDEQLSEIDGGVVIHARHDSNKPSESDSIEIPKSQWTLDELGEGLSKLSGISVVKRLFS